MTFKEARARFQVQGIDDSAFGDTSGQEEAFKNCVAFLDGVEMTRTAGRLYGSYGLKHQVERAFSGCYVYEGTLILAALSLGYTCQYTSDSRMTCRFNMRADSLKKRIRLLTEGAKAAN